MKIVATPDGTWPVKDEVYYAIRNRRSDAAAIATLAPVLADADKVKERFEICKACGDSRDQGHKCVKHSGCCFGKWRAKLNSECPNGKW